MINIQNVLAGLFPTITGSRRIVDVAGLPSGLIAFDPAAITNWHNILSEALREGTVSAVIEAALQEYPENQELRLAQQTLVLPESLGLAEDSQAELDAIQDVCRHLTLGTATTLNRNLPAASAVVRHGAESHVDLFLASDLKWCVLIGQSGVGKSTVMASTAMRLASIGWSVLLVNARQFTLNEVARSMAARVDSLPNDAHWHRVLIEPWMSPGHQGFILMIDGLDEQSRDVIETELTKLIDELNASPQARVKVILSSGEVAWQDLRWGLPLLGTYTDHLSTERIYSIQIEDFDDSELNEALTTVAATEYTSATWIGGRIDPEIDAVRELLKHPATFSIFAEARGSGALDPGTEITWAELLHRYVNLVLGRVSRECRVTHAALRDHLIRMASLAYENGSQDFRVEIDLLRIEIPDIKVDGTYPRNSPCASLIERGLLESSDGIGNKHFIGFSRRNVGSYFLSFALETKAEVYAREEVQELIAVWLEGVYDYPPVIDAIVAWVHRLSPDDSMHAALVQALIINPSMRLEVLFRTMPPSSAWAILEAVGNVGEDGYLEPYRTALLTLPPSPDAFRAFRNGLQSDDLQILRLAIRAVGSNRDIGSVSALIVLLEHENEEIRRLATRALGLIGSESVSVLLAKVEDLTLTMDVRNQALVALRATGYRTSEVYYTLNACLCEGAEDFTDLRRNALLAAAGMRTPGLTDRAIDALGSPDSFTVIAAAKLLTEVPDPNAGDALLAGFQSYSAQDAHEPERYFVIRQLIVALRRLQDSEHPDETLEVLRQSLATNEPLSGTEAAWICEASPSPTAMAMIFERLICDLRQGNIHPHLWQYLRILADVWEPATLKAMSMVCQRLEQGGTDVAGVIVDALIASMNLEIDHPFRDSNARRWALALLARCNPTNLGPELARLLPMVEWPFDQEICDILWILQDRRAEPSLLAQLRDIPPDSEGVVRRRQSAPLYALATCGTVESAGQVLAYLRIVGKGQIQIDFPERVLVPMVRNGVITGTQLVTIVDDESASEDGRIASMLALFETDAEAYAVVFSRVVVQDVGPVMQGYAAGALGLSGDTSMVPLLKRLVSGSEEAIVVVRAARALALLSPTTAARDIEQALTRFGDIGKLGT